MQSLTLHQQSSAAITDFCQANLQVDANGNDCHADAPSVQ
jgi:hypothetical protein